MKAAVPWMDTVEGGRDAVSAYASPSLREGDDRSAVKCGACVGARRLCEAGTWSENLGRADRVLRS